MSMDLPQLLEPGRIRCRCDIHSKKRALQTLAELLGASLRHAAGEDAEVASSAAPKAMETSHTADPASADGSSGAAIGDAPPEDDERPTRVAHLEQQSGRRERGARKGAFRSVGRSVAKSASRSAGAPAARSSDGGATNGETEGVEISDMAILDALIARERLGSTGLGHGVALPHSRLEFVDTPLAAMITLNEGVDFEAGDGEPVDLVLGLLVPQDCNDEHLKILANLARRFNDAGFRETLREQKSGEVLFEHLQRLATNA